MSNEELKREIGHLAGQYNQSKKNVEILLDRVSYLEGALRMIILQRPHVFQVPRPLDPEKYPHHDPMKDWATECPVCKAHIECARLALEKHPFTGRV